MHLYSFGGQEWRLLADRALYWPARGALVVADLHFEKASWYARTGQFLPPFDSEATLSRLSQLATATDARELWCLGDNFHDDDGPERLPPGATALLADLSARLRLVWITGNHDDGAHFAGECYSEVEVDGILLRHETSPSETRPELSGHFHPKVRVTTPARTLSRPCFLHSGNRLILPAYGALTGGLDVHDHALRPMVGDGARALVATEKRVLTVQVHGRPAAKARRRVVASQG
jgi:uncharacterized protein